jgi:hypothetical protein
LATQSRVNGKVSAFDFDILCSAYRDMVGDVKLDDELARRHARDLVRDLTGVVEVDDELISSIIRR